MAAFFVVFVTCPTRRHAMQLANALVSKRLAACVNVLPSIESVFWWQGKIDHAKETLLLIKTTPQRFEPLRRLVCALHPYEIPEIVAVPIVRVHQPYGRWVQRSLRGHQVRVRRGVA